MHRIFLSLLLLFSASTAYSETVSGRIVGITDGDTLKLVTPTKVLYKIRLSGIDAPEKGQPFGQRAKQTLSTCSNNKNAIVETYKKDRYGRFVGKVLVDGVDCNLKQIELGMAWHYKKYENEQELGDRSKYAHAEHVAKGAKQGLWSEASFVPPWDWRKSMGKNK